MSAKDTVRNNKTKILEILCGDRSLILNKVHEKNLITGREYQNLKIIYGKDEEGHVTELVDKIMTKGENTCQYFLTLLQTDEDIKSTFPELKNIQLNHNQLLPKPVQASSWDIRESLSEVFSGLGFRVLMCKDQTKDQMDRALKYFASLSGDLSQLQEFNVKEWSHTEFTELQQPLQHGDAFICCILSHGKKGVVFGIDWQPLCIKQITRNFKATDQSPLTGKPKVFLIQACQGDKTQHGVILTDVEADDSSLPSIPEEGDFLVAYATVEDHAAFRHKTDGSWFVQSLCQQLQRHCPRGEDITTILHRVNNEVGQKEGSSQVGAAKQMPEVRFTLRKKLVLSPQSNYS
ncbi:Caspase-8 [Channa argus]|uniref:Caspase-8 n=1 Tax=Channa argus TaxID=215402 RepID=A0A6G1QA27_CHAAH|nr:Caspase-8 [Channa argus]